MQMSLTKSISRKVNETSGNAVAAQLKIRKLIKGSKQKHETGVRDQKQDWFYV